MVGRSGAVLMDLRSFSSEQKGCIYEIRQLFECIPLTRIVMVVDDTTNMRFFEDTLSEVWNQTPVHAPNRASRDRSSASSRAGRKAGGISTPCSPPSAGPPPRRSSAIRPVETCGAPGTPPS